MGMAKDQLVTQSIGYIGDIEGSLLFSDLAIEDDMEEYIPQLLLDLLGCSREDSIGEFIDFLDGIGAEALCRLLPIPRALGAEAVHDIQEAPKGR